jgi:hypothetical protein
MKKIHPNSFLIRSLMVIGFACALFSFSFKPGGDSFSVYLNDKLLLQQFVHLKEKPKTISLQQASSADVLRIHYSHCGKMGVARNLFLKDDQNRTLKAWKFENSEDGDKGAMTVQAADIATIQKKNGFRKMSLIYSSEQLPDGILIAYVSKDANAEASIK